MKECSVNWCSRKHYSKGFCDKHYYQIRRYGKILEPIKETPNLPGEVWKSVNGYEGYYEISNLGRVASVNYAKMGIRKVLSPKHAAEYDKVVLALNGKHRCKNVHRLVAENFIPNPNNLEDVNHIDGNKRNNQVSNLEWVSRSDNVLHSIYTLGNNPRDWTKTPVICVDTGKIFETQTDASKTYGIPQGNIGLAARGIRKTAGGYRWKFIRDIGLAEPRPKST